MYIHPPHGATQISNPNFASEGVGNSSQNPSNPAFASEGVANSSQNPSNPASASEGIANPSQKPCTHNPKLPQHIIPFLNWLTTPECRYFSSIKQAYKYFQSASRKSAELAPNETQMFAHSFVTTRN
jgi:hypothetical protein